MTSFSRNIAGLKCSFHNLPLNFLSSEYTLFYLSTITNPHKLLFYIIVLEAESYLNTVQLSSSVTLFTSVFVFLYVFMYYVILFLLSFFHYSIRRVPDALPSRRRL